MAGSSGESVLLRVVRMVESFGADTPTLRVSEVARHAGLQVATACLIDELVGYGWLKRDEDRNIWIGVRLWELASRASPASPALGLREAAMPFMEDLHAAVGHHVQLGVREDFARGTRPGRSAAHTGPRRTYWATSCRVMFAAHGLMAANFDHGSPD